MTVLTTADVGDRHRYLAHARPGWRRSMESIRNEGGPWDCGSGHASLLPWRCSICGRDMADVGRATSGREGS